MVSGGMTNYNDESGFIKFIQADSTEVFSDNVWRTVVAKLPAQTNGLRIATINNRVLSFGNSLFFMSYSDK